MQPDRRPEAVRPTPSHQLSPQERQQILAVCHLPEYASLPPSQIVPKLADQDTYLASESTFYRVLKAEGQLNERGRARKRRTLSGPRTHLASGPNQLWSWDITFLPSTVKGRFYYLYLVEDVYSRFVVAWEVHAKEAGELAVEVIQQARLKERCFAHPPVLHADNGAPMKSQTLRVKLREWGIAPSHSRPGVSDDNAFVESLFRTLKYSPKWPAKGFGSLEEARQWTQGFIRWYNHQHQHSQIRFVTPAQRHTGEEKQILENRERVYTVAKEKHPRRWSGKTRNWKPKGMVALNPTRLPDVAASAA